MFLSNWLAYIPWLIPHHHLNNNCNNYWIQLFIWYLELYVSQWFLTEISNALWEGQVGWFLISRNKPNPPVANYYIAGLFFLSASSLVNVFQVTRAYQWNFFPAKILLLSDSVKSRTSESKITVARSLEWKYFPYRHDLNEVCLTSCFLLWWILGIWLSF